eukprot:764334-Hanusia_phi.AAC.2
MQSCRMITSRGEEGEDAKILLWGETTGINMSQARRSAIRASRISYILVSCSPSPSSCSLPTCSDRQAVRRQQARSAPSAASKQAFKLTRTGGGAPCSLLAPCSMQLAQTSASASDCFDFRHLLPYSHPPHPPQQPQPAARGRCLPAGSWTGGKDRSGGDGRNRARWCWERRSVRAPLSTASTISRVRLQAATNSPRRPASMLKSKLHALHLHVARRRQPQRQQHVRHLLPTEEGEARKGLEQPTLGSGHGSSSGAVALLVEVPAEAEEEFLRDGYGEVVEREEQGASSLAHFRRVHAEEADEETMLERGEHAIEERAKAVVQILLSSSRLQQLELSQPRTEEAKRSSSHQRKWWDTCVDAGTTTAKGTILCVGESAARQVRMTRWEARRRRRRKSPETCCSTLALAVSISSSASLQA